MPSRDPDLAAVREEISREIAEVHLDSYGEAVENISVEMNDSFVAMVMDIVLTPAERLLIDGGRGDLVRAAREEYQIQIEAAFRAVVERASGRRVEAFASRTVIQDEQVPWAAEIFRLSRP